jgi:hypothetical protein
MKRTSVLREKGKKASHSTGKLIIPEEPFPEKNNFPSEILPLSPSSVAFQEWFPPDHGAPVRFMKRRISPVGWIDAPASPTQTEVFSRGAIKEA